MENYHNPSFVINYIKDIIDDQRLNEWNNKKSSSGILKVFKNQMIDKQLAEELWKHLNLKPTVYKCILSMQENTIITGYLKAKVTKKEEDAFCPFCKKVASVNHILLCCKLSNSFRNTRHDNICWYIYERLCLIMKIYNDNNSKIINNNLITIKYNKNIIESGTKFDDQIITCIRPDIYLHLKEQNIIYLFEITVCADKYIDDRFISKFDKYKLLQRYLVSLKYCKQCVIIPVVFSISGFVHFKSREMLDFLGLQLNWIKMCRNICVESALELIRILSNTRSMSKAHPISDVPEVVKNVDCVDNTNEMSED